MEKNRYLTTGEFASLMHVTKETLFHYDRIGLFSPEAVGENGYRLYGISQVDRMNTIMTLREMDLPLSEIRRFLQEQEPETLLRLFEEKEEAIRQQIARLQDRQRFMKQQRERLQMAGTLDFSRIYVRKRKRLYYMAAQVREFAPQEFTRTINQLMAAYEKENHSICYEIGYFQRLDTVRKKEYADYQGVAVLTEKKPQGRKREEAGNAVFSDPGRGDGRVFGVLEAGDYVNAYHQGHWKEIGEAYDRLFAYADRQGLRLAETVVEKDVVDFMVVKEETSFVTEISVRILSDE